MIDRFKESFREETNELLTALENSLLRLDEDPNDKNEISAVFRAVHTIKGSASMFGFQHISEFTHEIENILDNVRSGTVAVSKSLIDNILVARDQIRDLLAYDTSVPVDLMSRSKIILDSFHEGFPGNLGSVSSVTGKKSEEQKISGMDGANLVKTFRLRFRPQPGIMKNGTQPLKLLQELRDLGECTIIPFLNELPGLQELVFDQCYFHWDILLTTTKSRENVLDVFMFVMDTATIEVLLVDTQLGESQDRVPLGKILIDRGVTDPQRIEKLVHQQRRLGDLLEEDGVPPQEIRAALDEQEHIKRTRQKMQQDINVSSIRVSSEKLDVLVDLVGELVTLQARLSQTVMADSSTEITSIAEQFERLTDELRDQTMGIRMLPIGSSFTRFKRLVRDLAKDLGKEVELVTEGAETELDKTVLERLNDPLIHIIRSSLDHGLATADARRKVGKPTTGTVSLAARHTGANVTISICDDGRGLDVDAIKRKAIEKGLIQGNTELAQDEICRLIFMPGFSTASKVTSVSGRGVGMDVVKKELENLGGTIHLDSVAGQGTCINWKYH